MALDVTGSDAESYVSVAEADTYWSNRNNATWAALSGDVAKEAALREATQFIDAQYRDRFVGHIQSTTQNLEWPRLNAYDRSGRYLNGIPQAVKDACCELALAALSSRLVPVEERGGQVTRKKVKAGPVESETVYRDTAPSGRTYDFADRLLSSVLQSISLRRV